ncbi:MAG: SURF1 family protein [Pseudomonadales bacterium]
MIRPAYHFDANWKVWLFVLILLPVLLRLGFWQLERAEEKRALLARYEQQRSEPPLYPATLRALSSPERAAFRRVLLRGEFLANRSLLLDNQVLDGRVGYQLLQPFLTDSGDSFLVNRGWLPGAPDRSVPGLPAQIGSVEILASVYIPAGKPVLLAADDWSGAWPLRVQYIDVDRVAALLERDLYPYVLRIEADQPGALTVRWPAVNTRPAKHTGYAVQWFAMSLALLLCGVFASLKRIAPGPGNA